MDHRIDELIKQFEGLKNKLNEIMLLIPNSFLVSSPEHAIQDIDLDTFGSIFHEELNEGSSVEEFQGEQT